MKLSLLDYFILILFALCILFIVVWSYRKNRSADSFFKGGDKIHWITIGLSLIATDLSIGYIIGSSGVGFEKGLAAGSYGWTACIVMIFVALYILPKFMRVGVLTLPEYLELRYHKYIRLTVAIIMILVNATAGLSQMFYSTALLLEQVFQLPHEIFPWLIWTAGLVSAFIILSGGLSVIFRTDVIIASLTLAGGIVVFIFCMIEIGGVENFVKLSHGRVHALLPSTDTFLPWTQVLFGGLWLMHLNYWAFNQSIVQKVLVSKSLSEAQKGMLLAAAIKIFIPFLFVIPGIIGYELFSSSIHKSDEVFPVILREVIPLGLQGFVIIAFVASVIGVANAILHATATMFTHDIYKRFIKSDISDAKQIQVYRLAVIVTITVACLSAPLLSGFPHIFTFSQQIRSMIAPALIGIFLMGLFSYRTSVVSVVAALVLTVPNYFLIKYFFPSLSNPDVLAINFLIIGIVMLVLRFIYPLEVPRKLTGDKNIRFERNLVVVIWGISIFTVLLSIYVILM